MATQEQTQRTADDCPPDDYLDLDQEAAEVGVSRSSIVDLVRSGSGVRALAPVTREDAAEALAHVIRVVAPAVASLPATYDRYSRPTHTLRDLSTAVGVLGELMGWIGAGSGSQRGPTQQQALAVTINLGDPPASDPAAKGVRSVPDA